MGTLIAPSILAGDFGALRRDVERIAAAGGDRVHWDVMDGRFVPAITFGPQAVADCRAATEIGFDCHLMTARPEALVPFFIAAGADEIVFHVECGGDDPPTPVGPTLTAIRAAGRRCGLSLRPGTPLGALDRFLPALDVVLVMSVEPGRGGQAFIPDALERIRSLAEIRGEKGHEFVIEVDGGINFETGPACVRAGADLLVAGSSLFSQADLGEAVRLLRAACEEAEAARPPDGATRDV